MGFIGVVHVEALRRLGVQVHGGCVASHDRASARSRELGLPPAYESFQAMLDDPRVEVVHITTPNHLHHEQAKAALQAGKHVVCEKPLTTTSVESADLLAAAERSGLVHAVNFNLRYYPVNQHARGLIAEGALGEIRLATGRYLQDWLLLDTDWNWRLQPELGGVLRTVGDIGSHWMDMSTFLTGRRIESVMADLTTFIKTRRGREIKTEDAATILLRFEGGARGTFAVSQVSAGRKNSFQYEIGGSKSSVAWGPAGPADRAAPSRPGDHERARAEGHLPSRRPRRGFRRHLQGAVRGRLRRGRGRRSGSRLSNIRRRQRVDACVRGRPAQLAREPLGRGRTMKPALLL